ncbi:MAG: RDD family protein [Robiginitomaculum sp.]|nr:RDD family protein [Robiginitomaculum sp.]
MNQPKARTRAQKKMRANITYNADKNVRTLVTPEGIDLRLRIADGGARVGAFTLDLTIMIVTLIAVSYALSYTTNGMGGGGEEVIVAVWMLFAFFLRNFYFMFFEMGPKAATPGKMAMKIRVANRHGGHLKANAVFARNAMRELEFFLPLSFFLSALFMMNQGVDGWLTLLGLIWSFIFLLFPLFNKDRLRAGDLIAGTWVVQSPKPFLSKDLAESPKTDGRYRFSQKQIDAYGVKELHVLENVLRKNDPKTVEEVTARIMAKIEWPDPSKTDNTNKARREFLNAYYAALRGKLETKLLFGVRREDKFDKR